MIKSEGRATGTTFTASFGVTPAVVAKDLDLLLARADSALFEAKRNGRDRVVSFAAEDLDDAAEREVLLADTRSDCAPALAVLDQPAAISAPH